VIIVVNSPIQVLCSRVFLRPLLSYGVCVKNVKTHYYILVLFVVFYLSMVVMVLNSLFDVIT